MRRPEYAGFLKAVAGRHETRRFCANRVSKACHQFFPRSGKQISGKQMPQGGRGNSFMEGRYQIPPCGWLDGLGKLPATTNQAKPD